MQIHQLSLTEIAQRVRSRDLSPVEVVRAHFDRIDGLNPRLNAFIQLRRESALVEAQTAEAAIRHDEEVGPLHGVPISIKSSIAVAGLKHECGNRTRAGVVAPEDAVLVQRL